MNYKKLIIICLLFLICILPVKAEDTKDVFKLDWETEEQENPYPREVDHHTYKDGYIMINTNSNYNSIAYYDSRGNLIREKDFKEYPLMLETDDEYIYAFTYESLLKLDEKLNVVKSLLIDDSSYPGDTSYFLKEYGYNQISIVDETIAILGNDQVITTDKDLNDYTEEPLNENTVKKYFPIFYFYYKSFDDDKTYNPNDISENRIVSVGRESCPRPPKTSAKPQCTIITIKYEENNEVVWSRDINEYKDIYNIKIISDYIVGIGEIDEFKSEIFILDLKGNKVQTIAEANHYISLNKIPEGFIVGAITEPDYCDNNDDVANGISTTSENLLRAQAISDCSSIKHQVYYLSFNIETKITGKGTINVVPKAKSQEEVEVEIIPEKGYILGEVKVTDKDGNVLTFTSSKFTMPSSDVTIEVAFLTENPTTKDVAIVFIAFSLLIGAVVTIINYRKIKWLK